MDSSKSLEDRVWIWNRYGAAYRAMWTLYEVPPAAGRRERERGRRRWVLGAFGCCLDGVQ